MNGDGYPDIFRAKPGRFGIAYGNGDGTFGDKNSTAKMTWQRAGTLAAYSHKDSGFRSSNHLIDANSDGLPDIIKYAYAGEVNGTIQVLFNKDGANFEFKKATAKGTLTTADPETYTSYGGYMTFNNQFVDFNGDGNIDIRKTEKLKVSQFGDFYTGKFITLIGTGQGKFSQIGETSASIDRLQCWVDSSADGVRDDKDLWCDANKQNYYDKFDCGDMFSPYTKTVAVNGGGVNVINYRYVDIRDGSDQYIDYAGELQFYDEKYCSAMLQEFVVPTGYEDRRREQGVLDEKYKWSAQCTNSPRSFCSRDEMEFSSYDGSLENQKGLSHSTQFADINGDGYIDLVTADGSNYIQISFGKGDGTFGTPFYPNETDKLKARKAVTSGIRTFNRLADMNADGKPDFVWVDANGVLKYRLNQFNISNRIEKITNGLGKETIITYKPLAEIARTQGIVKATGKGIVYPLKKATPPLFVAEQYTISDGLKNTAISAQHKSFTYAQRYYYPHVDLKGGGFLYEARSHYAHNTFIRKDKVFELNYPLRGHVKYSAEVSDYMATQKRTVTRQQVETKWASQTKNNIIQVYKTEQTSSQFPLSETQEYAPTSVIKTSYVNNGGDNTSPYDLYGNPEKIVTTFATYWPNQVENTSWRFTLPTLEKTQTLNFNNAYYADDLTKRRGRLQQQTQSQETHVAGSDSKDIRKVTFFNANGTIRQTINHPNDLLENTTSYQYDSYGNVQQILSTHG